MTNDQAPMYNERNLPIFRGHLDLVIGAWSLGNCLSCDPILSRQAARVNAGRRMAENGVKMPRRNVAIAAAKKEPGVL